MLELLPSASRAMKQLTLLLLKSVVKLVAMMRLVAAGQTRILGVINSFDITWKVRTTIPLRTFHEQFWIDDSTLNFQP
jgi:hypothetical protein